MEVLKNYGTILLYGWIGLSLLLVGFIGLTQWLANRRSERFIRDMRRRSIERRTF